MGSVAELKFSECSGWKPISLVTVRLLECPLIMVGGNRVLHRFRGGEHEGRRHSVRQSLVTDVFSCAVPLMNPLC